MELGVMTIGQRQTALANIMRKWSDERRPTGSMRKVDAQAAVDAVDQWVNDNGASFNLSLPDGADGARTNLSSVDKAELLRDTLNERLLQGVN